MNNAAKLLGKFHYFHQASIRKQSLYYCRQKQNYIHLTLSNPTKVGTSLRQNFHHLLTQIKFYCRYGAEMPMVLLEVLLYMGIITLTRLARPSFSKLCYRRFETKSVVLYHTSLKFLAIISIIAAYIVPFIIIPHTIHPVIGWSLYLLGSFSFCSIAINALLLPTLAVLAPCIGTFGVLLVMAFPWYKDGVARALAVFAYAFCASPILWVSYSKVLATLQISIEREAFLPSRLNDSPPVSGFNKLY